MSAADRKAELERKKAKLQQMREEKKRKEEERKRKEVEELQAAENNAAAPDLRSETEKMLQDLGIPPPDSAGSASRVKGVTSSQLGTGISSGGDSTVGAQVSVASPKMMTKLTMSKTSQTSIPPKEVVSYSKETQTPQPHVDKEDDHLSSSAGSSKSSGDGSPRSFGSPYSSSRRFSYPRLEWEDEFFQDDDNDSLEVPMHTPPALHMSHKMPHVEPVKPADSQPKEEPAPHKEEKKEVKQLTEDEKRHIMMSESFNSFVDYSSRIIERALTETTDIFIDYTGADRDDQEGGLQEGEKLKLNRQFFDERWSKHRTVTCMDWSTQHPELLVASYNNNEDAPHEPDGVALIWNTKYKKNTPEYIFHCQSAVMSSCFAKFHPNLVIGGTYSGQIVLWDNRSHKRTPAQRTPLSAAAHTHPVYCVNVVGTQNAHNLISVSTDGKMCSWSLDMLSTPQDSMELQHKQSKAVAATSMSFLSGDVNNFIVGSEEGAVYTACRHGSKAGIADMFEAHQGPVTGIDCHNVQGQIDFSPYFLSSSFDWTIKLWNIKESKPLHSFEDNSDYVYDVKWSPIHPALFASVDGMGRLDLWNLNHDIEVPIASTCLDSNSALNRCRWHQTGHQIAVGDDSGKVHIYDVGENVAVPRNDEWNNFVHSLQDIRANQADQEEEGSLSTMTSPLR